MVNLGKQIINIGNGSINLGENFIESLCVSYWKRLTVFARRANKAETNSRRDLLEGQGRLEWQRLQAPRSGAVSSRPSCVGSAVCRQAGRSPGLCPGRPQRSADTNLVRPISRWTRSRNC